LALLQGETEEAIFATVQNCALRLPADTAVTPGFTPLPNGPVPRIGDDVMEVKTKDGRVRVEFAEDFKTQQRFKNYVQIQRGSIEWNAIKNYIHTQLPDPYRKISIKKIRMAPHGNAYVATPEGIGSSYCMNIGRNHNSNTVYFVFKADGMVQRCNCTCDTLVGRRYGLCKKYQSQVFQLGDIKEVLFPDAAKKIGRLLFSRKAERKLDRNERYQAAKNVVCRLGVLLQQYEKDKELAREIANDKRQGKYVSGPPRKKARKIVSGN